MTTASLWVTVLLSILIVIRVTTGARLTAGGSILLGASGILMTYAIDPSYLVLVTLPLSIIFLAAGGMGLGVECVRASLR